jgi:hypothetical protein
MAEAVLNGSSQDIFEHSRASESASSGAIVAHFEKDCSYLLV